MFQRRGRWGTFNEEDAWTSGGVIGGRGRLAEGEAACRKGHGGKATRKVAVDLLCRRRGDSSSTRFAD